MGRTVLPSVPRPRLTSIAEEERKIFAGEPGGLGLQDIAGVEGWTTESYVRYLEKTNPLMVRALAEQLRKQKDALRIAAMGAARVSEAIPRLPLGPTVDVAMQAAEGLPPTFELAPTLFKTGIAIPARVDRFLKAIQRRKTQGVSAADAIADIGSSSKAASTPSVSIQFKAGAPTEDIVEVLDQQGVTLDKLAEIYRKNPKDKAKRIVLQDLRLGRDLDDDQIKTLNEWLKKHVGQATPPPLPFQGAEAPLMAPSREVLPGGQSSRSPSRIKGPPGSQMSDAAKRAIAEGEIEELPSQYWDPIREWDLEDVWTHISGQFAKGPQSSYPGHGVDVDVVEEFIDSFPSGFESIIDAIKKGKDLTPAQLKKLQKGLDDTYEYMHGRPDAVPYFDKLKGTEDDDIGIQIPGLTADLLELMEASTTKGLKEALRALENFDESILGTDELQLYKRSMDMVRKKLDSLGFEDWESTAANVKREYKESISESQKILERFRPYENFGDMDQFLEGLPLDVRRAIEDYSSRFGREGDKNFWGLVTKFEELGLTPKDFRDMEEHFSRWYGFTKSDAGYKLYGDNQSAQLDFLKKAVHNFRAFGTGAIKKFGDDELEAQASGFKFFSEDTESRVIEIHIEGFDVDDLGKFMHLATKKSAQEAIDALDRFDTAFLDVSERNIYEWVSDYLKKSLKHLPEEGENISDPAYWDNSLKEVADELSGLLSEDLISDIDRIIEEGDPAKIAKLRQTLVDLIEQGNKMKADEDLSGLLGISALKAKLKKLDDSTKGSDIPESLADMAKTPQVVKEDHPLFALDLGSTELAQRLPSEFWKGGMNRPTAIKLLQESGVALDDATEIVDEIMAGVKKAALDLTKPGSNSPFEGEDVYSWVMDQIFDHKGANLKNLSESQLLDAFKTSKSELLEANVDERDDIQRAYNKLRSMLRDKGVSTGVEDVRTLLASGFLSRETVQATSLSPKTTRLKKGSKGVELVLRKHGLLDDAGEWFDKTGASDVDYKEFDDLFEDGFITVRDLFEWLGY